MEGKKSFLFYTDWTEIFDSLSDETAGKLIKHICSYVSDRNPVTEDEMVKVLFIGIRQTLKRDLIQWKEKCAKNTENGLKGGRPKKKPKKPNGLIDVSKKPNGFEDNPEKPNGYFEKPKKPDRDKDSDRDKDMVISDGVGYRNGIDAADIVPMHITQVITELKTDNDWLNAFDYPPRKYVESQLPLFENHCIREKKVNRNKSETIKHFNAWMNRRWTGLSPETRRKYKP